MKSVLYIDIEGNKKPFAKIIESNNQVIFSPIAIDGDHMTIHKKSDGSGFVFTYSDNNKVERVWDNAKVELARRKGYRNPEKHRNYIANRNMAYADGFSIPLITLHINEKHYLDKIPERYASLKEITIPVTSKHFELSVYFCSRLNIIPEDTFHAVGHEGQFVTIVPSYNTVIVRFGKTRYPQAWRHDVFVSNVLTALDEVK